MRTTALNSPILFSVSWGSGGNGKLPISDLNRGVPLPPASQMQWRARVPRDSPSLEQKSRFYRREDSGRCASRRASTHSGARPEDVGPRVLLRTGCVLGQVTAPLCKVAGMENMYESSINRIKWLSIK